MDGYSEFCRNAILEKIAKEFNDQFCDDQIKFYEQKILEFQERKKLNTNNFKKMQGQLDHWYNVYKDEWRILDDKFQKDRVKRLVLPDLKKYGFMNYSEQDILEIFENHAKEGKVLINV